MSLYTDIKTAYPDPVKHDSGAASSGYCVGGACVLYGMLTTNTLDLPHSYRFPDECQLADKLLAYNPKLAEDKAYQYACDIVYANDRENFRLAWRLLKGALGRTK